MIVHAVAGILQHQGKILIAERPEGKPYSGYWEFPGGKVEANESSEAALIRELHEEIGIQVIASKQLFTHTHTYPDKQVLLDVWSVSQFLGEPHGRENQRLAWMTIDEMMSMNLLEGNWPIIKKLTVAT